MSIELRNTTAEDLELAHYESLVIHTLAGACERLAAEGGLASGAPAGDGYPARDGRRGLPYGLLAGQGPAGLELSLSFVTPAEIQALNRDYRAIDAPTDILSFALAEGDLAPEPDGSVTLGDIFIAPEVAALTAERQGQERGGMLTILVIHGVLHLLGLDHEQDEEQAARMEALEDALLETWLNHA
jgi:probable rRNA maturation factor